MKTILSLLLCTALITNTFALPLPTGELVTVKVVGSAGKNKSIVVIAYGNGKSKIIELDQNYTVNYEKNQDRITNTLNDLIKEGYKLIEVSGGDYKTTYIFEKQ